MRAPPRAVPRRRPRRLHPRQGRPGDRAVQAGPARRDVRPAPPGAGAAHHPGRRRARAPTSARRASSSSSSASTCACRCGASASPGRAPSPRPCAASCATPPPGPRPWRCCWVASGERTRTLAPHHLHHRQQLPGILTASKAPRLLGNLTYLVGTVDLLTGLLHSWRLHLHGLTEVLPGALSDAAAAATVVSGIFLIVLGPLAQAPQARAWRAAVGLLALSVVLHVDQDRARRRPSSRSSDWRCSCGTGREFRALGDPTTRWRAVRAFVRAARRVRRGRRVWSCGSTGATSSAASPGSGTLVQELGLGMVGARRPAHVHPGPRGRHRRARCCWGSGLMTLLTPAYLALRPPEPRPSLTADDEARLRALVDAARRLARLLQHPPRQVGGLVLVGQVGHRLPRRVRA